MSTFSEILNKNTHTVSTVVKIEGRNITADPGGLLSIYIYKEINKIPTARIIFADGLVERGEFPKSDSDIFLPGKKVEILVGYQQDEESIFEGIITKHNVQKRIGKPSVLEIECKDTWIKTTLTKKSRYFYELTDNELIQKVAQDFQGLTKGISETTSFKHKELVQYQSTDWDFLVTRAEANGLLVHCKNGKMNWVKPKINRTTKFICKNQSNVIEFELEIDAKTHYPNVEAVTWDYTQQKLMNEKANIEFDSKNNFSSSLFGTKPKKLYHGGDKDTQELKAWASAQAQRAAFSHVSGRVIIIGVDINPTDTLFIDSVAAHFDGYHYVSGVIHSIHKGTWQSNIQIGLNDKIFAESNGNLLTASGLVPGIPGLQIGVVSKVDGDERAGDHRIQVRIPYLATNEQGKSEKGIWARLSTLYAGNDRGFVFRPEIDDEVIIGFINGDPNDAVVLGSLHSNKYPAPYKSDPKNKEKGLKSKGGVEFKFDDENESLEIKDKHGNQISLSKEGIQVKSSKKIDINGGQQVAIDATTINLG